MHQVTACICICFYHDGCVWPLPGLACLPLHVLQFCSTRLLVKLCEESLQR